MPRPCTASSIPGHTLSPCCGETREKEKESALSIFRLLLFLQGYPAVASAEERAGLMHVGDVSETNGQKTSSDHVT